MIDLVFPDGNEKELLAMAGLLGINGLIFCYEPGSRQEIDRKRMELDRLDAAIPIYISAGKKGDIGAMDVRANPRNADFEGAGIAFGFENFHAKDSLHYSRGGIDQIVARKLREAKCSYGIMFSRILQAEPQLIARVRANVKICEKYKADIIMVSGASTTDEMRSPGDLKAVLEVLGANTGTVKKAFTGLRPAKGI